MPQEELQICIDRELTLEQRELASARAIDENPSNRPHVMFSPGLGIAPLPPWELAALTAKKWANGRTLKVRFLDGVPEVQQKVEAVAHQWEEFANLRFDFGNDPQAEIRISFNARGSWSYLGTDALSIAANDPTMNFGWLTPQSSDDEISRVVLHEFGHALGCIHEHQNPIADIPWDRDAVYEYYGGSPNFWSPEQVDVNIFRRYGREISQFSVFDRASIMLYSISASLLTDPSFAVGWNRMLSETDKDFIGVMYPKDEMQTVTLTIGARSKLAKIGKHGEVHQYAFSVDQAGRYEIISGGFTDVEMTLFGPNDESLIRAHDNDSGFLRNARIEVDLAAGNYTLKLRHHHPRGRGRYTIRVRQSD